MGNRQGTIGVSVPAGRWERTSPTLMRHLALRAADLS
jgi:hypothetical protein